ncbi:MAG TPA: type VI secretion system lipoprotein TssJ [Steroidobacteraceae bacterium]
MRAVILLAGMGLFSFAIAGCRSKAPQPPPAAKVDIVVSTDVNPDSARRPSPIVVRLYQLKEEGAFNSAGYFALADKEEATLGSSLVAREEYELNPGVTRELVLKIPPEARYLAVVAGYRDLNNSKWKALSPAPESGLLDFVRKHKLVVKVGSSEVKIAPAN